MSVTDEQTRCASNNRNIGKYWQWIIAHALLTWHDWCVRVRARVCAWSVGIVLTVRSHRPNRRRTLYAVYMYKERYISKQNDHLAL